MREKHLENKVAWITGSSRGIGREIAAHLARCGAKVVVHGSSMESPSYFGEDESLAAAAERISAECRVETLHVAGDLSKFAVARELGERICERFGRIDILVTAAGGDIGSKGVGGPNAGKPADNNAVFLSDEETRIILDRNLMTCVNACKAALPGMIERKEGWVVAVGSNSATVGLPESVMYGTAKAAVHEYIRCLAAMVRQYGIYANVVAPGGTVTERFKATRPLDLDRLRKTGSLDRYGWPVEVARAVEFLVSEGSSFITGQVLRVDGGKQLWPA